MNTHLSSFFVSTNDFMKRTALPLASVTLLYRFVKIICGLNGILHWYHRGILETLLHKNVNIRPMHRDILFIYFQFQNQTKVVLLHLVANVRNFCGLCRYLCLL